MTLLSYSKGRYTVTLKRAMVGLETYIIEDNMETVRVSNLLQAIDMFNSIVEEVRVEYK